MEIDTAPRWHLSLRERPEIVTVGRAMVGSLRREEYSPVPFWQLGLFHGSTTVLLTKAGQSWDLSIKPQNIFVIPPHTGRSYVTEKPCSHYYLAFRFERESELADCISLPAIIPCGQLATRMNHDLASVIDLRETDLHESDLLAQLILWRLVRLSRLADSSLEAGDGVVQYALKIMRETIDDDNLSARSLADSLNLSRRRLDQLFIKSTGKPVSACIRDRRVQMARDLLRHTALPINLVGRQVGIPDAHAFNKFVRRNCGASPTGLRGGG